MLSEKLDGQEKPGVSPAVSERVRDGSSDGMAAEDLQPKNEDVDKPVEDVKSRVSKPAVSRWWLLPSRFILICFSGS